MSYQMTKEGVRQLEEERVQLETRRSETANNIKTAREHGDLSENAEYHNAIEDRQKNEARIRDITNILKDVEIIKAKNKNEVEVGNTVELKNGSKKQVVTIVGSVEANPLEQRISDESPIGQALLGKKAGESVTVGKNTFKIASIS